MAHAKITKAIVTGFLALIFCVALIFTAVSLSDSRKKGSAKEDALARSYGSAVDFTPEAIVDERDSLEPGKQISAVANFSPTAGNLAWQADYCGSGLATRFSWVYSDPENDPQAYYQVQIDDSSDFSSPADDSGKVASTTDSFAVVATKLAYHAAYRWRLKVWDDFGNDSGWISGSDFSTPLHRYPKVDFSWEPAAPKAQQKITFTDESRVCNGASIASRLWALGGAVPSAGSDAVMTVKYAAKNDYAAKLTVTDSSGYSCSLEKDIKVKPSVLDWDER